MVAKHARRWAVVFGLALVYIASPVVAQELDSARQAYRAIAACMGLSYLDFGGTNASVLDTSAELMYALNAGGRQVVVDWPYMAEDTIKITSDVFRYSLNSNFMMDSLAWRRYIIFGTHKSATGGSRIYNVPMRPVGDFDVVPGGPGSVSGAQVLNRTLYIFPAAPAGDTLWIYGPGDWVAVTSSLTLLTAVPRDRLWGAVYWAAMKIAANRNEDVKVAENREAYARHILGRRGAGGQ